MGPLGDNAVQSEATEVDILIVGLGPVGATLAALLGCRGIRVLAIESQKEVYPLPRAAHVDHEIMRIFQSIGLIDAIKPHIRMAPDYEFRTASGATIVRFERQGMIGASGWPVGFNVYQPGIERALWDLLSSLETVETARETRFKRVLANGSQGVTVEIEGNSGRREVSARLLIGCDGASSAVREDSAISLKDFYFDEPWLVLDARIADESGFPTLNLQFCDPMRPTSFVHMGPGRLRWEFMLKPDEDPEQMKDPKRVDGLLAPWRQMGAIEVERCAVYRFHGLIAEQWRNESVLLAGDAAHQMPPFLGQGLCSGLRDAANLAWKIGEVLSGSSPALLDTYQTERAPHVQFVVEKAIEMGRLVCTLDPQEAAERDAAMLASPRIGKPIAFPPLSDGLLLEGTPGAGEIFPQTINAEKHDFLDDRLGNRAWLIVGNGPAAPASEAIRSVSLESDLPIELAAPLSEWLLDRRAPAVLVRPDRYVFGTGDAETLLAAYSAMQAQPEKII